MCDLTIPSGYVPKTLFHLTSQPTLGMSSTSLSKTLPCIPALQQHRQQYNMLKNTDPNIDKRLVSTLTFATSPQRNKSYLNLIYTSITISVPLSNTWPSHFPCFWTVLVARPSALFCRRFKTSSTTRTRTHCPSSTELRQLGHDGDCFSQACLKA